jgi:hypothetical protein
MLGIFFTALFLGAISVYVFHDVDPDKIGHFGEAFLGLALEAVVFSVIIGGAVWPLSLLGRRLLKLRGSSPRAGIGLLLGMATAILAIALRLGRKKILPGPRGRFSRLLSGSGHLALYRGYPPRHLPATDPSKNARASIDRGRGATSAICAVASFPCRGQRMPGGDNSKILPRLLQIV